eukprot:GFYU01000052.1.p1 GENE.GFYU01000052.1~~GFYU01000052.1.p1  ORF type:complete len:272 (-),score=39.07 GFYU01000052.1:108-923(-)
MPQRSSKFNCETNATLKRCADCDQTKRQPTIINAFPVQYFPAEEMARYQSENRCYIQQFRGLGLSMDKDKRWELFDPATRNEADHDLHVEYSGTACSVGRSGRTCTVTLPSGPAHTDNGDDYGVPGPYANPSKRVAAVRKAVKQAKKEIKDTMALSDEDKRLQQLQQQRTQTRGVKHKKGRSDCQCDDCVSGYGELPPSAFNQFLDSVNSHDSFREDVVIETSHATVPHCGKKLPRRKPYAHDLEKRRSYPRDPRRGGSQTWKVLAQDPRL